jgi:hypothetical protein
MFGVLGLVGGLAFASAGCLGSADALDEPGGDVPSAGDDSSTVQSELRRRSGWRGWSRPTTAPAPGTAGTTGATGSGGGAGAVDTSPPSGGATDTGSGSGSGTGIVDSMNSGGRCPDNRAMPEGGACGPYGLTCTYDDTASHLCICLNSSSTGRQGWTCR